MSNRASSHSAGQSVAFDLGSNAVRVVEVEWSGADRAGRLVKRGSADLPINVWNDLPANAAAFTAALRQAMSSAGITARSVSACLPRRLVTLRFARLPHVAPELMRGLVTNEAQQYVLFPLDEVMLDYHVANEGGIAIPGEDDLDSVLLAAARKSLVTDLIGIFEKAGLELDQLTVSALALAEHIRDSIDATAVIDVEPGEMDVAIVASRQLLFTRASGLDVVGAQPDIAARRLTDEIARSFTSFQNEYRQQVLSHISLSGPSVQGSEGAAIEQTLSSVLEMPISRLSGRLIPAGDPDAIAYATALGVALQTRPDNIAAINLVPDERAIKRALEAQKRRQQFAALAGIAALAVIILVGKNAYAANKKANADKAAANAKLQHWTDIVDTKRKAYDKNKALYEELTTGLDRAHPSVAILAALNRALPPTPDIWFTQLAFDRSGLITLHGDAKSATDATNMVITLQASGAFTDVKVAYLGDSQENNVVSSTPVAKAEAPASETPTVPLPGLPPAGAPNQGGQLAGGPGVQNGYPNGQYPGGFRGGQPGGYPGAPQGFQPGMNGQSGQYFPGGPQSGYPNGQFPNGQVPAGNGQTPNGSPQNTPPTVILTPGAQPNGGNIQIFRINPDGGQPAQVPSPQTPPPFYLIGYGQDQNGGQPQNGGQNFNGGQDSTGSQDPNSQDPNSGRRRRRNRNNGSGNNFQGFGPGGTGQGNSSDPNGGNFTRGNRNRGNFNNPYMNMPNSGVTPYGPGSSNQMPMQNGPMPPQGGPTINPTVAPTKTQPVKPAPVRKVATEKPKAMLTSFIITCRLNPQGRALLTTQGLTPMKGSKSAQPTATPKTRRPIGEDSDTPDNENGGGTDGSPQ